MSYVYVPHRTIFAEVKESSDELLRLIGNEPSKVVRKRLMALQLYVSGQGYNATAIANKLGAAPASVRKVFDDYREKGLKALLDAPHKGRPKGVPKAVSPETLETVRQELSQPDAPFNSYGDIQKRFEELEGKPVAYSSAHHIARHTLKAKLKRPRPSNVQKNAGREETIKKRSVC